MEPLDGARNEKKQVIYVPAFADPPPTADEVDLLELWKVLWRGKWFIAGFTLACTLIAVAVTLYVLPVTFRSEAALLPTDQQGASLNRLAGLAGSLPIPFDLPGGGKSDHILAFLQSRNLKQRLIEKYDLLPHLHRKLWDEQHKKWLVDALPEQPTVVKALQKGLLDKVYSVRQEKKSNLISLAWEDEDPAFAAVMLERVIGELRYFLDHEYESDAQRERQFVEQLLHKATQELEHWERQVPRKELALARIQRELGASQVAYTELRKQLEIARISEAREIVRFKVLDSPFVPEQKYKPKRLLLCALALVAAGMLSVLIVFGHHFVQGGKRKP